MTSQRKLNPVTPRCEETIPYADASDFVLPKTNAGESHCITIRSLKRAKVKNPSSGTDNVRCKLSKFISKRRIETFALQLSINEKGISMDCDNRMGMLSPAPQKARLIDTFDLLAAISVVRINSRRLNDLEMP